MCDVSLTKKIWISANASLSKNGKFSDVPAFENILADPAQVFFNLLFSLAAYYTNFNQTFFVCNLVATVPEHNQAFVPLHDFARLLNGAEFEQINVVLVVFSPYEMAPHLFVQQCSLFLKFIGKPVVMWKRFAIAFPRACIRTKKKTGNKVQGVKVDQHGTVRKWHKEACNHIKARDRANNAAQFVKH